MANIGKTARVIAKSGLNIRKEPSEQSTRVGGWSYYTTFTITDERKVGDATWYKSSQGWGHGNYIEIIGADVAAQSGTTIADSNKVTTVKAEEDISTSEQNITEIYNKYLQALYDTSSTGASAKETDNLKRYHIIHGLPFQFNSITDRRYAGDEYGRVYAKNVIPNMPVAIFNPGAPKFLTGWTVSKKDKDRILFSIQKADSRDDSSFNAALAEIGQKQLEYFSFQSMYNEYMNYVNTLCRASAVFMGIGDKVFLGRKLSDINWKGFNTDDVINSGAPSILGLDKAIAIAYEPMSGISDGLSNNTSESALASKLKGVSDIAKEAEFVLGAGAGVELESASDENIETLISSYNDVKKYDPNNMLKRWGTLSKTVATGANVRFPEIWRDSMYSKSYSIDIKLASPYGDKFSKWLHVLVPFWHIFCLGGPRAITPNTYSSPFIIRAFSKGYFNCELGIVDSINFKKFGDGDGVGEDGIPTEMDITLSFKDLYNAIALTRYSDTALFFNNSGLIDLIGTSSGMNMNRASMVDRLSMWADSKWNWVRDAPGNFTGKTLDIIRRKSELLLGRDY